MNHPTQAMIKHLGVFPIVFEHACPGYLPENDRNFESRWRNEAYQIADHLAQFVARWNSVHEKELQLAYSAEEEPDPDGSDQIVLRTVLYSSDPNFLTIPPENILAGISLAVWNDYYVKLS